MGMNLAITRQTYGAVENHKWLGSAHGTNATDPVTLQGSDFIGTFTDGIVPSGVVLAKYTGGANVGKVTRYVAAGANGAGTPIGHLYTTTDIGTGQNVSAANLWHGEVVEAKLPTNHGLDTAAKTALPRINYV